MIRQTPLTLLRGFLMGAADIVPGVSGGTIALVVGIYERLVSSIRAGSSALGHLIRGDWAGSRLWLSRVEWSFLIPLLVGILTAVILLAGLLEDLLHDYPVEMAGLFMGLIGGSAVVAWGLVRQWNARRVAILVISAAVVFILLGLRGGTTEDTVAQVADPTLLAFFGAGALAICAMILPGISGSFILVLLGMYGPVLAAVNDRDLLVVATVGIGAVVGLAVFSQILHWSLEHHHDSVMAALIGLMVGSLRVLWPWPQGLDSTALGAPDEAVWLTIALAVVAFASVVIVGALAHRFEHQPPENAPSTSVG